MFRTTNGRNGKDNAAASYLSSNHKVAQYLQTSTHCTTNSNKNNDSGLINANKASLHSQDLLFPDDVSSSNNYSQFQRRTHSYSENSTTTSGTGILSQFDCSLGSSLSDPGGHSSTFSSNASSSGVYSAFSEAGQEELTSTLSADLDFNIGFEQVSDNVNDIEIANLDDMDEYEHDDGENQQISNKNTGTNESIIYFFSLR